MSLYCMARIRRLDLSELRLAETHARRLDPRSRRRQICTEPPVTWIPGGIEADPLALEERYHHHVDGAFIPKGDGRALHMLVKFPSSVPVSTREDAAAALALTVDFARSIFGDEAVFAARMDRDETSLTNADLFIAPRYLKKTKHSEKVAISLSRDLKRVAERRGGLPADHTVLAAQGSALQDEFTAFLRTHGYQALRGRPKQAKGDDWFSPEAYGATMDREIVEAGREANRIEREILAREQAEFEETNREQKAAFQAMTEAAAARVAQADVMLADAARSRTDGTQLLEQARAEQLRVDRLAKTAADQGDRLAEREQKCRLEEERIASKALDIANTQDALCVQADALGRREIDAFAREEAVYEREAALARIAASLADQAKEIENSRAEAMAASAEAERTANALRHAAAADRDRARQSVIAGLIANEQMALIARAADDEGLELRLAEDERGISMNEAAMSSSEREAYQQPWSKLVREFARAVATMLSRLRDRFAAIVIAQRKAEADIAKVTEEKKAIASERQSLKADMDRVNGDRFLAKEDRLKAARTLDVANKFLDVVNEAANAWDKIPDDRRSPEVTEAVRRTGIAQQAASLAKQEPVRARAPDRPTALRDRPSQPKER